MSHAVRAFLRFSTAVRLHRQFMLPLCKYVKVLHRDLSPNDITRRFIEKNGEGEMKWKVRGGQRRHL